VPRHPPCALTNLTIKMLASTVQFSNYGRSRSQIAAHTKPKQGRCRTTGRRSTRGETPATNQSRYRRITSPKARARGSILQDPTARLSHSHPTSPVPAVNPLPRQVRKKGSCTKPEARDDRSQLVSVPPLSLTPEANVLGVSIHGLKPLIAP
jgi:hypothetical protein